MTSVDNRGDEAPARAETIPDRFAKRSRPRMDLRAINPFFVFVLGLAVVLLVWALFLNG